MSDDASADDDSRVVGVEFGDLEDDLERESYPMSKEALIEKYGDRTLEFPNGSETLRSVLEPYGDAEFEGASDVTQSILGMVDDDAVGEREQTDRGATSGADQTGTTGTEDESF